MDFEYARWACAMKHSTEIINYLDPQGRVVKWPSRQHRKLQRGVLEYLASKFRVGEIYSERQVNEILNQHHTFRDPALLRRELVEKEFMRRKRDGSAYWLVAAAVVENPLRGLG